MIAPSFPRLCGASEAQLHERGCSMDSIGFVGLGTIGGVVAGNIQKAGHAMVVYDIAPEAARPLVESGARLAISAAEVARQCRVVLTSLPGPREVEAVALGAADWSTACAKAVFMSIYRAAAPI